MGAGAASCLASAQCSARPISPSTGRGLTLCGVVSTSPLVKSCSRIVVNDLKFDASTASGIQAGAGTSMDDRFLSRQQSGILQALMLVARGVSEREAVARVSASQPNLTVIRQHLLASVLEITKEQDVLDRIVQSTLTDRNLGTFAQVLFRLVAYNAIRTNAREQLHGLELAFRDIVPTDYISRVEILLATLVSPGNDSPLAGLGELERVSLETHHPKWWVEYCFKCFGRDRAIQLLSASPRPRYIRVNPFRNKGRTGLPPEAAQKLTGMLTKVQGVPGMYASSGSPSILTAFFAEGLFQVQDLASFLAVKAAEPKPGERVLDLCAAPGGKTSTMAQMMKNRGTIVSVDYSLNRMRTWKRETARLGVKIAEPVIADATGPGVHGSFDLVLVDPPCSGTGVLDRNPRMKWNISPQSLSWYSVIQRRLLDSAQSLVSPTGRILYCTCSVTLEENEQVLSSFFRSHADFETKPVLKEFGSPGLRGFSDCRRFYPHRDRTAGYFIARIQRI